MCYYTIYTAQLGEVAGATFAFEALVSALNTHLIAFVDPHLGQRTCFVLIIKNWFDETHFIKPIIMPLKSSYYSDIAN
jgi:hypothetical protein